MAAAAQPAAGQAGDHPRLPPGKGRELTIRACSSCHEAELVADQQLDPAGWKRMVDDMAAKGIDATEAELAELRKLVRSRKGGAES